MVTIFLFVLTQLVFLGVDALAIKEDLDSWQISVDSEKNDGLWIQFDDQPKPEELAEGQGDGEGRGEGEGKGQGKGSGQGQGQGEGQGMCPPCFHCSWCSFFVPRKWRREWRRKWTR